MPIKISILIPVYNVEKYLEQCLDSVINQTLKEIEIICVNDGSTDDSLQILEDYAKKDHRIRIVNKVNGGISSARNMGLDYVNGEYIGFVDSDDWIELDMYEKLYKNAKFHDSDIVMFPGHLFDENTQELKYNVPYFTLECLDDSFDDRVFSHLETKDFLFNISVTPWNKIYRSQFIKDIGVKFPEGLDFDDNPFFYETYLNAKRISLVRDYLYFYRINRIGSFITSGNERYFDIVKMYEIVENIILKTHNQETYMAYFSNVRVANILAFYEKVDDEYRKKFFEIIKTGFQKLNPKCIALLSEQNKTDHYIVLNSETHREYELAHQLNQIMEIHEQEKRNLIASKERELEALKHEYAEELKEKKQLIQELTSSNSWKITKPFRLIGSMIRNH
jgi:glycosyltransferase involved in cell wall biosynthesis